MGIPGLNNFLESNFNFRPLRLFQVKHFDNLYIDMNGLIHPITQTKTESQDQKENEKIWFDRLVKYMDRLMKAIQPKNLLFISIDGLVKLKKRN
jgi:5'-3' exoribonuclease 2